MIALLHAVHYQETPARIGIDAGRNYKSHDAQQYHQHPGEPKQYPIALIFLQEL
jgi:hypothetical protein